MATTLGSSLPELLAMPPGQGRRLGVLETADQEAQATCSQLAQRGGYLSEGVRPYQPFTEPPRLPPALLLTRSEPSMPHPPSPVSFVLGDSGWLPTAVREFGGRSFLPAWLPGKAAAFPFVDPSSSTLQFFLTSHSSWGREWSPKELCPAEKGRKAAGSYSRP